MPRSLAHPRRTLALLAVATLALPVTAQPVAPVPAAMEGLVNLSATATVDVAKDVLTVVFSVTREGADAQAVQSGLKQALDAALAEARKVARPGQVEVQTGQFSLYPRYGNPTPRSAGQPAITGWQGTAELVVQGKDVATVAQLTGRVQTMTIARVGYSLSREAREKVEADVQAQAVAQWRARAALLAQQFGYSGYRVREVSVSTNEPGVVPMVMMARGKVAAASPAEESLPTEPGKAQVTATVGGTAQMLK